MMARRAWPAWAVLLATLAGCGPTSSSSKSVAPTTVAAAAEEAESPSARLRRDSSPEACRSVIAALNAAPRPATPDLAAAAKAAGERFALSPAEVAELAKPEFTALDAQYLSECLFFREGVRGLNLDALPPAVRAERAFDWVCRMQRVAPRRGPAVPARFAALRGSGDGLERAYVLLAAFQQLGLSAALAGPEGWNARGTVRAENGVLVADAPFMHVAVAVEKGVRYFDPFAGTIVPADAALKLTLAVSPPLPALASRAAALEAAVGPETGVRLKVDAEAFPGATAWAPRNDPGTFTRVLGQFLPLAEGGLEDTPVSRQAYPAFALNLVPWGAYPRRLDEMRGPSGLRIKARVVERFASLSLTPPAPWALAWRGLFDEATRELTAIQAEATRARTRATAGDPEEAFDRLSRQLEALDARASRATRERDAGESQRVQEEMDRTLQQAGEAILAVDRVTAAATGAEAAYVLCLCQQEKAEREFARWEAADAAEKARRGLGVADLWRNSLDWWRRYARDAGRGPLTVPDRLAHARAMVARAESRLSAAGGK